MVAVQGESRKFLDRINMIDRIMDNGHGLNPVIVLEYTIPEGADAKAIYISTTRQGALSGLSVLGVTQY